MRFVENDPRSVGITWFFVPDGTPFVPWTRFASGNWQSDKSFPWEGIGEVKEAPRPWYNGKNIWGFTGDHRCGTDQLFAQGLPFYPGLDQWDWCCCPWPARFKLGLNPGAIAPPPPPPPSYEITVSTEVQITPFTIGPCLCLTPDAGTAPPIAGYSIGVSVQTRILHSLPAVCLCLLPGSATSHQVAVSSGPGEAPPPVVIPPFPAAPACLCLVPDAFVTLGPAHSGYGVSVPPFFGSSPVSKPSEVAGVCLCLSPAAGEVVRPNPPSGPFASVTGSAGLVPSPAGELAGVCLCLAPAASSPRAPSSSGLVSGLSQSVGAGPPMETAVVCLCLLPAAADFPQQTTPSGASIGTSSANVARVQTPCCKNPLPAALNLHIAGQGGSGSTGCACMNGDYTIQWNPLFNGWTAALLLCSAGPPSYLFVTMSCVTLGTIPPQTVWQLVVQVGSGPQTTVYAPLTCTPVFAVFNNLPGPCVGTWTGTVSEI